MKIQFAVGFCTAALVATAALAPAQDLRDVHFGGTINDYSPSTISGGPWEIRGGWSVDVVAGAGSFTGSWNMETSDYGISDSTQVDPTNPATRSPHTHYITMTGATVSYDTSVCPANSPATTGTAGVVITGTVNITANGSPAPFESKGSSTLQICITGGPQVTFSNVTLVFTGPATSHFGPQVIHGVVSDVSTK